MPHNRRKKYGSITDWVIARRQRKMTKPAIGFEAEFTVMKDGELIKPEKLFGSPRSFIRGPMMHRVGRSYHLPTGGAVYFDTGVIEVATPMIELEPGCAARAGRSLWESIDFIRQELTNWEQEKGYRINLAGFSAHYNVSFELPKAERGTHRTVQKLALLLTYILPFPVMLLAANRESTGVGVRPRSNRIEITADFTPDASLSVAAATLIVGIVREVMTWPSYELEELERLEGSVLKDFAPVPHSSRKGWVANITCYPINPFQCDVDQSMWETRDGQIRSLREIARRTTTYFSKSIRHYADPLSRVLISAVMTHRSRSLLDLSARPAEMGDVGRACAWHNLYPEERLSRSRYERVLLRAISRIPLILDGEQYTPTHVRGWSHVVFRRESDGREEELSLDQLVEHLRR